MGSHGIRQPRSRLKIVGYHPVVEKKMQIETAEKAETGLWKMVVPRGTERF